VQLEGPDVLLDPRAFSTLALVTHELLTNSAKYGAARDRQRPGRFRDPRREPRQRVQLPDRLIALGVPIVFATGYGKNIEFPERFAGVPVVSKPYNADSLMPKIAEALRRAPSK
jgi:hypothetical protein